MIDLHNAGPLIAEVARLREEVAALKAEADRLYSETGFTVAEMIAHDEAMDAQAAALKAEAARLAGVAREACDNLRHSGGCDSMDDGPCDCYIAALRASIPTPDPAVFVAAVERLMDACAVNARLPDSAPDDPAASPGMAEEIAAKAALLALGGVR